ncbi:ninein-like protein, partial [Aplysia californica]|uniref:Ninein-like protein n=1 Tax=Aplysia californica TaxID=6500 RepID=A0ABM0ZUV4_APLCA
MASRRSLDSGRAEYETRLQELFEESDVTDKGYLDREEVNALCSRLQLGRLKDKVVQALQGRSVDKNKVVYEDFRHVFFALLEELEAQQTKSPRRSSLKADCLEEPEPSPKATPKLVIGRKKYGRRSLPFNRETDMKSPGPEGSYSQFLQDLSTNDRSSPCVEVEGKQVKRRRQQTRAHAMHGDKT